MPEEIKYYCPTCDKDRSRKDEYQLEYMGLVQSVIPCKHTRGWRKDLLGASHWAVEQWACPSCFTPFYKARGSE